ncbi:NADH dehydrogenase [ubiquinone] 1 alpha subcomplex subunit 8 [Halotydeus destructor]|nr:NADH dehydrogenase [ubiquinone] 1 alpha subcomplex subunit 8 [Halotydeus destructor]
MAITDDVIIPSDEELTVQEINVSSPVLRATSNYLGFVCDEKCKEFMLCRQEEKDPRKCIKEGRAATACGVEFLQKVKQTCADELTMFAKCIEWNSYDMNFEFCRKEQAIYDACIFKNLGIPKPMFGHFAQLRLHESSRVKPAPMMPEFPGKTPGLPKDYKEEPAIQGSRNYFWP